MNSVRFSSCVFTYLLSLCALAASAQSDSLLTILETELDREYKILSKAAVPAYYIHYALDDLEYATLSASFGSLTHSSSNRNRVLNTQVRVGDYTMDNTHPLSPRDNNFGQFNMGIGPVMLPVDNEAGSLNVLIWQATQNEYKQAMKAYKNLKSAAALSDSLVTGVPDFSKEHPSVYREQNFTTLDKIFDKTSWEEKVRRYSKPFLANPDIIEGDVVLRVTSEKKYFLSSEGSRIVENITSAYINVSGAIRTKDGDIVPLHLSYYAPVPGQLPADEKIVAEVEDMVRLLQQLKTAPLAEPYSGPAILLAQTAGVFFHEIFGHRIEGHRLKNEYDGQTFKSRINQPVLPRTLSVYFDPTVSVVEGKPVNGAYKFDDEGVKSKRVDVVDKGVLKTFLMSRTPLDDIRQSNGHGRAALGATPVSRQSNLIVKTSKPVSMADLRKQLVKECKKQGKAYGYFFKEVVGGFTVTDRYNPNAFNIFPTLVYRIYADGRPDELVRGVDLIGTPLAMFAEIQAASDDSDVFIGFCGAESGSVPVSATSPSLFVRRIETQKKPRQHLGTTILERPAASDKE